MLAQIAEEIRAPDRAAQGIAIPTGEGGNSDHQDLGLEVKEDDPTEIVQVLRRGCACS